MAISSSTRKAGPFIGNDATTVFPFAFKVFTSADLRVVRTNALGVESDLVLDTDYTVALNANQDNDPGGTVTRGTALPTGERLTITSDVEALQPLVLTNNGGFYPRVINDAFDKITIIAQQLIEQVGRSLKLPISSTASATLPDPVANRLIAWNSSANGFTNVDPASIATVAAYADAYIDLFTGNGTQTAFTLTHDPAVLANLSVSISGVTQVGGEDFTWIGTTLTFLVAPPNGTRIQVRYTRAIPPVDLASAVAAAEADRVATAADRVQTGLDRVATAADVVSAEADRVATAADRVQTGLDAVATAADRVQTGLDRVQTGADVVTAAAILSGKQPLDADLTAIANLTSAANKMPYATGAQTWALADLTSFARTLLAAANNSAFLTALGQIASTFVDFLSTLSGAVNRTLRSKLGDFVSVKDFGALGDGIRFTDGAITSGTDDFVSASSVFVAGDVGKTIVIEGAGAAGVQLITTITARVSSTAVTLAANASTTVSSADGSYATDDTAAINAALAVGGCLYFPKGIYQISDRLLVTQNNTFIRMEGGVTVQGDPWTYPGSQSPFGAFFVITGDNCSIVGGGMGQTLIQIQGGSQAIGVCFLHCAGGYVAGLTLDGDKINGAAISDDTFQTGVFTLNDAGGNPDNTFSNAIVYDVECRNWLQYGAQTYGIFSRTTFQDCWFHDNGKTGDAHSVGAGLTMTRGPRGNRAVNCLIEDNKSHGIFGSSAGVNSYDITLTANTIRNNGSYGVSWTEEAPFFSVSGVGLDGLIVAGNQIYGNTTGGERYGTYDSVGFIKNVVSDNINYDNGDYGVLIQSNNDATNKVSNVDIRGRITANTTGLATGSNVVSSVRWNAQNITGNGTDVSNNGLNTFYSGALGVGTAVASASTITLPADGDIFTITGTTTINTITASPGRTVTLVPTSAVTFSTSGNIDSPTNINAAANDAVQFTCIGSTWYIVAANAKNFPTLIADRVVSDKTTPTSGQFTLTNWGNTSTVTDIAGGDQCVRFRITSGGTGQAQYPTVRFTFGKAFAVAPTIVSVQRCGGNQNDTAPGLAWFSPSETTTYWEFRWLSTPIAGEFYLFTVTVI